MPSDLSSSPAALGDSGVNPVSFGVDNAGEPYLLTLSGGILRLALVPAPAVDAIGCAPLDATTGQTVSCDPLLSGGAPASYEWTVDGLVAGSAASLATAFATASAHSIELTACNSGGCDSAAAAVTVTEPPASARVTDDLLALYELGEGGGSTVSDSGGVGPVLTIAAPGAVSWPAGGGLSFDASTIAASSGAASAISGPVVAANAITVEAWVRPVNTTLSGPARVVTISQNPSFRNVTLGQQGDDWVVRLRTTTAGSNGLSPAVTANATVVPGALTHVLYTRDAGGSARLYVNGVQRGARTVGGNLSNWDLGQRLALGNELSNTRPWLGEIHLVALYARALTPEEVTRNFEAGAHAP